MATLPPTTRAWTRTHRGPPSSTLKLTTIPTPPIPAPSSSEVLIRVSHVSLQFNTPNFLQIIPTIPFTKAPFIPEIEFSGTIIAAGNGKNVAPEVSTPGTSVIAFSSVPSSVLLGQGVLAEYVRVPGENVARVHPSRIENGMAAASGINGCGSTALKMLRVAGVRSGQTVLVNGASGSVGSVLVQLARLRGARVAGVASGGNEEVVRELGVDEFIDYRKHDLPAFLASQYNAPETQFDHILDCVGTQALFANSPSYLKPSGTYINIGMLEGMFTTTFNWVRNVYLPTWLGGVPRKYIMFSTPPTRDDALYIAHLVEEGDIRILVDGVWEMEDAMRAYERIGSQRARGKVVVRVWDGKS
ncbi:hypothetical protein BDV18DRAFT_163035 [Aspergillus unguis]